MNKPTYEDIKKAVKFFDEVGMKEPEIKSCLSGKAGQYLKPVDCEYCGKTHWKWVDK